MGRGEDLVSRKGSERKEEKRKVIEEVEDERVVKDRERERDRQR